MVAGPHPQHKGRPSCIVTPTKDSSPHPRTTNEATLKVESVPLPESLRSCAATLGESIAKAEGARLRLLNLADLGDIATKEKIETHPHLPKTKPSYVS